VGTDQCDIAANRVLQQVIAAIDGPQLLTFGERGADAGRAEECSDARSSSPHAFGQVALRYHLKGDLARAVQAVEYV